MTVPPVTRWGFLLMGLVLVLGRTPLGTAGGVEGSTFRWRSQITVPTSGLVRIQLPDDVVDGAESHLGDLRLQDSKGVAVPYILLRGEESLSPSLLSLPVIPEIRPRSSGDAWLVDAQAAAIHQGVTALRLLSPTTTFIRRVRVDGSPDRIHWQPIASSQPIYRVDVQDGKGEDLEVEFPPTDLRWLRLWVDDPEGGTLRLAGVEGIPPLRGGVPDRWVGLIPRPLSKPEHEGESEWDLPLPARHLPLRQVEIIGEGEFYSRTARLEEKMLAADHIVSRLLGSGRVARMRVGRLAVDQGRVEISPPSSSQMRLRIPHGDDAPLALREVRVQIAGRQMLARAEAGELTLLYGNPALSAPSYDLAAAADELSRLPALLLHPSPRASNPDFREPEILPGAPTDGAALEAPALWPLKRPALRPPKATLVAWELDALVLTGAAKDLADLRLMTGEKQVPYILEPSSGDVSMALSLSSRVAGKRPGTSRWTVTLPLAGIPLQEVRLETDAPIFRRPIRIGELLPAGTDGPGTPPREILLGETVAERRGEGPSRHSIRIPIQGPRTASLFIEMDDGDNPPLPLRGIEARHPRVRIHAKVPKEGDLLLLYGNPQAQPPRYDLALLADEVMSGPAEAGTWGEETGRRPKEGPSPWRTPSARWVMGGAVALLAAALAVMGWRLLRTS